MTNTALQLETDPQIRAQLEQITALNVAHQRQVLQHSKAMLDKLIPLAVGSHAQVQSYVVYYQHVLAFFADGQSSGLQQPAQFVALCGSREKPQSLLFTSGGRHLELSFARSGDCGSQDCAGIDDLQLQLDKQQWFSLVRGTTSEQAPHCLHGTNFTSKFGGDYRLDDDSAC